MPFTSPQLTSETGIADPVALHEGWQNASWCIGRTPSEVLARELVKRNIFASAVESESLEFEVLGAEQGDLTYKTVITPITAVRLYNIAAASHIEIGPESGSSTDGWIAELKATAEDLCESDMQEATHMTIPRTLVVSSYASASLSGIFATLAVAGIFVKHLGSPFLWLPLAVAAFGVTLTSRTGIAELRNERR